MKKKRGSDVRRRVKSKKTSSQALRALLKTRILDHLAHYVFKVDVFNVMEDHLIPEIKCKARTILNDHVPDVVKLFASHLMMDMRESDVEARISKMSTGYRHGFNRGDLPLASVPCLVLDGQEDEFLLGKRIMQDIVIDIDGRFDQLADGDSAIEADEDVISQV
ncbi:hypothetical protein CCR75_003349 [Bremia lactucae]|uniref:Uncharacterized protein n=1 Tax=Bremia lactucae TaxID=4779 RepID=A0A976FI74_BRELC|nr:hypothetical protein CCR75_003349 [Bremia lactucae]